MVNNDLGIVFTPYKIGNVEISNRLVRSATFEYMATEDGFVTNDLIELYEELARGGIGLTITGVSYVREDSRWLAKMVGNYSDELIEGLSKIAGAYHDVANEMGNDSKIFLQIGACGVQNTHWGQTQAELVSSSPIENEIIHKTAKALKTDEILEFAEAFGDATNRAKKAGFNGVQYHGAHGYLITQFYSPYMNKRIDNYGGSTENRARFLLDILEASRKKVGNNFPICLKMNGLDRIEGGLTTEEAAKLAIIFSKAGIDAIEISSYIWEAGRLESVISLPPESQKNIRQRGLEAFNLEIAKEIKNGLNEDPSIDIPIILVGGLYRFDKIRKIIETTDIEFCAMSRPLIRQPNLPSVWQNGPPFSEAECVHCNLCVNEFLVKGPKAKGLRCIKKEKEERRRKRKTT